MPPVPWKCAVDLEALADSLAATAVDDAERLRNFARLIRKDGCHIAIPCEGCSGTVALQELLQHDSNAGASRASPDRSDSPDREAPDRDVPDREAPDEVAQKREAPAGGGPLAGLYRAVA